jgi:uncharacterized oxidoreductase
MTPTYSATKAAIHSFTDSLRAQLHDTSLQVIELVPPAVRTTLMNQQDSPDAMPLDEYLDETLALLEAEPDATQILVERVRWLRNAEAEGHYDQALAGAPDHPPTHAHCLTVKDQACGLDYQALIESVPEPSERVT